MLGNRLHTSRAFHPELEEDEGTWSVQLSPDGTARFTHRTTGRTHTTLARSRRELHPPRASRRTGARPASCPRAAQA